MASDLRTVIPAACFQSNPCNSDLNIFDRTVLLGHIVRRILKKASPNAVFQQARTQLKRQTTQTKPVRASSVARFARHTRGTQWWSAWSASSIACVPAEKLHFGLPFSKWSDNASQQYLSVYSIQVRPPTSRG